METTMPEIRTAEQIEQEIKDLETDREHQYDSDIAIESKRDDIRDLEEEINELETEIEDIKNGIDEDISTDMDMLREEYKTLTGEDYFDIDKCPHNITFKAMDGIYRCHKCLLPQKENKNG